MELAAELRAGVGGLEVHDDVGDMFGDEVDFLLCLGDL